jgi:CRISPR-associated endonuclease/helicase Cas3
MREQIPLEMGSGLAASAQLEAFRRRFSDPESCPPARSLRVSATLRPEWLRTVDFRKTARGLRILEWNVGGTAEPGSLSRRLDAVKRVRRADTRLLPQHAKKGLDEYAQMLAREVLALHRKGLRTRVIVNQVRRAQAVYQTLRHAGRPEDGLVLSHSRFRRGDLQEKKNSLSDQRSDQIVVATQAVEAGVGLTSAARAAMMITASWRCRIVGWVRCWPKFRAALPVDA